MRGRRTRNREWTLTGRGFVFPRRNGREGEVVAVEKVQIWVWVGKKCRE